MLTMEQIKAALPLLTNYELQEIRKQITVLLGLGGGGAKHPSNRTEDQTSNTEYTDEDFVLRAVCTAVQRANGSSIQPHALRGSSSAMASLRQHLPNLIEYIEAIDPLSRHGFLDMAMTMLVENIKQQMLPVTPLVVIRNLRRLPALVDVAFPGYYANGLLGFVIRTKGT
jgi:hypothetical protein